MSKTKEKSVAPAKSNNDNEPMEETEEADNQPVPLSEEFQARTLAHLKGANKHELRFVRDQVGEHEDALRAKEEEENPVSITDYPTAPR